MMTRARTFLLCATVALSCWPAYAADKNGVSPNTISVPKGPGSIEGLGESFQPSLNTGTAKYGVRLMVPPGTVGHAPTLALQYDGGGGNGILGFGWSLPMPFIQRQTDHGIPTYGESVGFARDDRFINELKEELVPAADGNFFCKNEGAFVRYRRVGDHWEGTTPTGTRMEFGLTPQARVRNGANGTNVFSWLLERQTDTRGNTITFSYASFPGQNNTNQIYLETIRYGPGSPPWTNFHFVRFHYESRPDWFEDCRPGFEVRTGQRLKRIDIGTQGPDLAGSQRGDFDSDSREDNLVRRYLLQYATNGTASHWSLLASVTQIGSDGVTALPPARFDYLICDPPEVVSGQNQVIGSENTPPFVMDNALADLVDLNGDGLPDLLKTDAGGGIHTAYLNMGPRRNAAGQHILWEVGEQISGDPGAQIFDLQSDESTGTHSAHLADMDGDGAADFVVKAGLDNVFYFANQNNRRWGPRSQMTVADVSPPAPFGSPDVRSADIDFDKRVDIIRSLGAGLGYHVWFNLGNNAYSDRVLVEQDSGFSFDFNSPAVQIADINGDRIPDVAQIQPAMVTVTTGLGYGRFSPPKLLPLPGGTVLNGEQLSRARLTDLNGDGLADLVVERAEGSDLWYWLNLGIYAFDEQRKITGLPVPTGSAAQIRWADMNGNGTVDYVFADRESEPQIQTVDLGELIGCGSNRNLLNSVANGIGGVTRIGYESSTHFRLLDAAAGVPWPDPTPFSVPVISSITNLDSMGHAYITRFQYHNGYYDPEEKQFRGFARVEQIDVGDSTAPTLISRSYFDTGRSFEAMKGKQLRMSSETDDGRTFRDVFTAWQIPPRVLALGTNGQSVSYTHPVGTTNIIRELGQGIERRVESEFAYDQFGNQTVQRDYGIVENANRRAFNDERFTITQYAINTNAWIVRHPKRREILDADDKVISRTDFFYDDETFSTNNFGLVTIGNLTLKHEWIFPSLRTNVIQSTRTQYDRYGNATTILDPLAVDTGGGEPDLESGHVRTISFDTRFHTYPVSETVYIGDGSSPLAYRATYHEGFATITSTLDFNGNLTRYGYDEFARLAQIIRPGDSIVFPTVEYTYALAVPHAGSNFVNYVELRQLDQPTNNAVPKRDLYFISRQFTDGLGRKLLTKREAGPLGTNGEINVVVSGATTFNQRQAAARIFNPFFSRLSGSLEQRLEFESVEQSAWSGDFQLEGRLVTLNSANAHLTATHYDAMLRAIEVVNPDRTTRSTIFEPLVSRSFDENDLDPESPHFDTPTAHYRDGLERLVRVDEITRLNDDGTDSNTFRAWTTRYEYDVNDRLTGIIDAQNNLKEFSFDGLLRMTSMKDPNRGDMEFGYDDAGNLLERVDAKRQRITYTYDGANRIRTEDYHDEGQPFSANLVYDPEQPLTRSNRADVVYFYDSAATGLPAGDGTIARARNTAGQLAYIWDLSGEEHNSYDERGRVEWRVKRLPDPHFEVPLNAEPSTTLVSYRTGFSYDSLDRITGITYPDNDAVMYEFDARTLPARIVGSASGATIISNITYWPSDHHAEITYGNGMRTTYNHDARQRLKALNTSRATAPDFPVIAFGYDFDGVSNIRRIDDHRPASAAPQGSPRRNTQLFDYDDAYRLRRVQHSFALPAEPPRNDGEITYRYDRLGNLLAQRSTLQHVEKGVPITDLGNLSYGGVAGASGRVGRGASDPPGPHALTAIDSAGNNAPRRFDYDANGNMTVMDGFTNTWDFKDRLVAVENADMHARYTFDHNDRRVLKHVDYKTGLALTNHRSSLTTLYPDKYFEVREHDAPTKYVFNGGTRVAQVTGSLSSRERIQRLRVHPGWNFLGVAVTSTNTFANQDPMLRSALRWNSSTQLWVPVLAEETLAAGTVLAVNASTNAILSLSGAYADPVQPAMNLDGTFHAMAGLERWDIASTNFPSSAVLWRYDPIAQGWMAAMATVLPPVSTPPISLAPGEPVFVRSDLPAALELPSPALRILFYHQDHIGSTSAVTDNQGAVIEETCYYAFGFPRLQIQQTPTRRPYQFAQKELDLESGLSYFEARYLASSINRFLSVDAAAFAPPELQNPQTLNVYSYAANRPITHGDPTGNQTAPVADPEKGANPQAPLKPVEILADEQSWSEWGWEIYSVVFGAVVEETIKVPVEGAIPFTKEEAEYHVNFQEGSMETEKMLKHAMPYRTSNIEEYQRIKGLSHADHIKEFHSEAAAKPKPTKQPSPSATPTVSDPFSWRTSQAERDAINETLKDSGGVPGYN